MAKYMYLFRGGDARLAELSNEHKQQHMQKWGAWMQELAQQGKLVDGLPLSGDGKVVEKAGATVHDGPFAEGTEVVGGYLIVNADSIDDAVKLSEQCPIFEYDGTCEVREILSM